MYGSDMSIQTPRAAGSWIRDEADDRTQKEEIIAQMGRPQLPRPESGGAGAGHGSRGQWLGVVRASHCARVRPVPATYHFHSPRTSTQPFLLVIRTRPS